MDTTIGGLFIVWLEIAIASVVGYLLGSISFTGLALRFFASEEQRAEIQHPSTQVGEDSHEPILGAYTTNRVWGARVGITIAFLDMLKVALPMWIFKVYLYPTEYYYLIVSVAGVIGHNWPIYFRFKGGRGVSAIFASFFVIDWLGPIALPFLSAILGLFVLRSVGLAYFGSSFLMFPWLWFRTGDPVLLLWVLAVNLVMYTSMVPDLRAGKRIREEKGEAEAEEAMDALLPGTRGMRKALDRIEGLGNGKYALAIFGAIILILVFWFLPLLPF
ncbi:glycerol-3-phosphate acyltransferase [Candidatus Thorarchaeota archaeon]|nr:MAG: glycerol-3-phosphate acyltransferase [Candidatus Thorarchaeota archaeon]